MINTAIDFQSKEFIELCRSHKVKELYAFGSVVNGSFNESSDIDLLVEINEPDPIFRGKILLSLYTKFQNVLNRKIDLLTIDSISNSFFQEHIDNEKKLVYSNV